MKVYLAYMPHNIHHEGHVAKCGASDWMERGSSCIHEVDARTTGSPSTHVLKIKSYNGPDKTRGACILTFGSLFDRSDRMRFITLITQIKSKPSIGDPTDAI